MADAVPGGARAKYGAVVGNKLAEFAQQLLHPAMDAGDPTWHRSKLFLGDLRDNYVWGRRHPRCVAYGSRGGSRRGGTGADLGAGPWRLVRAVDRVARTTILGALARYLWCRSRHWRLPSWHQFPIGLDLSPSHPLDRRGLGAGRVGTIAGPLLGGILLGLGWRAQAIFIALSAPAFGVTLLMAALGRLRRSW
jgi:hypothetical protein